MIDGAQVSVHQATNWGRFTGWPEGKCSIDPSDSRNPIYFGFTSGVNHGSVDQATFLGCTLDGVTFDAPMLTCQNVSAAYGATAASCQAWAFYIDSDGIFWDIVRLRQGSSDTSPISHNLRKSIDKGVTWTTVVQGIAFADSGGHAPVEYFGMIELSNGKLATCAHFNSGLVAIVQFDKGSGAYSAVTIFAEGTNLNSSDAIIQCEGSLVRDPATDTVLVYFRTQDSAHNSLVVVTTDNFASFTSGDTGIAVFASVLSPVIYGSDLWLFTVDRYVSGSVNNDSAMCCAYSAPLADAIALTASFTAQDICEVPSYTDKNGAWSGVQSVCLKDDTIHIFVQAASTATPTADSGTTDIFNIRVDFRENHQDQPIWSRAPAPNGFSFVPVLTAAIPPTSGTGVTGIADLTDGWGRCTFDGKKALVRVGVQLAPGGKGSGGSGDVRIVIPFIAQPLKSSVAAGNVDARYVTYPSGCAQLLPQQRAGVDYLEILANGSGINVAPLQWNQLTDASPHPSALYISAVIEQK